MRPGWQEAQDYVDDQRAEGRSEGEIAQALAQAGWEQAEIAELLWPQPPAAVTETPPPPAEAPTWTPPAPGPEAPPAVEPAAEAVAPAAPTAALPTPPPPTLPQPAYAGQPAPPQGSAALSVWALVLACISFVLLPLALLLGPVAIVLAIVSLAKRRPGQGMAVAALIVAVLAWLTSLVVTPMLVVILVAALQGEFTTGESASLLPAALPAAAAWLRGAAGR